MRPPNYIKRTKPQIKAAIKKNGGVLVKILPNKANPSSPWFGGEGVYITTEEELENLTNSCKYYMCNRELGNGVAYWIDGNVTEH